MKTAGGTFGLLFKNFGLLFIVTSGLVARLSKKSFKLSIVSSSKWLTSIVTRKKWPNVYKTYPRKMKDFNTFTKVPRECERFGQINCC